MITKRYPFRMGLRWVFLCLLLTAVHTQAAKPYDTSNITLHVTNQPIENIFKLIEKQTGLTFYYGKSTLDGSSLASVNISRGSLAEVMEVLLKGKNVSWRVKDNGIVLSKSEPAPAKAAAALDSVPRINVSGSVKDAKGNALLGATVTIKGQARGQGTDGLGRFSFTGVPANSTLVFSSLGFDPKQIKVGGRTEILVVLDSSIREIAAVEVVSTGYQDIPKERATGSFVQLDNKLINRSVSTNILDRIMNVTSSLRREIGGSSTTDIIIRGYSTINADMKPLVVIDGFPYDEGSLNQVALSNLNPNDVESITILRDAAAASIWGARSGNGVIVIKTKKGNFNKKTTVQLNANVNFTEKPDIKSLKIISSRDAIEFERGLFKQGIYNDYDDLFPSIGLFNSVSPAVEIFLAQRRGEISSAEAEALLDGMASHDVRDDLNKYLLKTAISQQYNVNVSGGSAKNSYYISLGYDNNRQSSVGNSNQRYSLRFDNTFRPINQLEINTYISYIQSKNQSGKIGYSNFIANGSGTQAAPYVRLADANGTPLHVPTGTTLRIPYIDSVSFPGLLDWHYRPLDELNNSRNINKLNSARLGANIRYTIIPGVSVEGLAQYEKVKSLFSTNDNINSYPTRNLINQYLYMNTAGRLVYPVPLGDILSQENMERTNWNVRAQVNVNKSWDDHQINAIAAYDVNESDEISNRHRLYGYDPATLVSVAAIDYLTSFTRRPFGAAQIPNEDVTDGRLNRTQSYIGNAGYTFRGKYIATVSGRIDRSNFLGAKQNQRMVPLWSAGLAWNISSEGFYHVPWMEYLKLRATYGYQGNLNNKATPLTVTRIIAPNNTYQFGSSLRLLTPPNPGLTWERIGTINIGVDYSLLNNRISGSLEVYKKRGIDLIGKIISEPTTGAGTYSGNYASMKSKGVDLILNTININRKVRWSTGFNLSYNSDEVTDYDDALGRDPLNANIFLEPVVGKPLARMYSYAYGGLDPANGNPRGLIKGKPVDYQEYFSTVTLDDMVYNGSTAPQFYGSILNDVSYKNISLSFNITYRFKYYFRRPSISYNTLQTSWGGHADYALRWQNTGDETHTNVPSPPSQNDSPERDKLYLESNILAERGDHIRLQDIRFSYTLKKYTPRIPFTNASIFLYANNIGIIWRKNKYGIDPDAYNDITLPRSLAVGMTVNF